MRYAMTLAVGLLVAQIGPAAAAELPLPSVSFIGEGTVCNETGGQRECTALKIYYTPRRFLLELPEGAILYDLEKMTTTMIDSRDKTYSVTPFDPKNDEMSTGFLAEPGQYLHAGEDVVGGTPTVKYKHFAVGGVRLELLLWVGADKIVRRFERRIGVPNVGTIMTTFDVTKLAIGPVDPKVLENAIPSDFKKHDR